MKYFTPDLFVRLQNLQDQTANEDWERAVDKYDAYLRRIRPQLPRPLRRIVGEFYLHDAEVLSMSRHGDKLSITLQLDPPTDSLLQLEYALVAEPTIDRSALPAEDRTDYVEWLYDEIKMERSTSPTARRKPVKNGRAVAEKPTPVYSQKILLSNGWEVSLRFRRFRLSQPKALLPSPGPSASEAVSSMTRTA